MDGEELVHLITRVVLQLAVIVAAAKIAGEISERYLRIPPVLGELSAGIIIGPFALGGIGLFGLEPFFGHALHPIGDHTPDISTEIWAIAQVASVVLLAVQAWLGKETVERELPPEIVTLHLGTALTLLAVLSVLTVFAFYGPERRRIEDRERASFVRLAAITSAILMVILLGGSYVVGSSSTTACTTWPGCLQAPIPFVDGVLEQHIHWAHRLSTLVGFGAVGFVALSATTLRGPNAERIGVASMALLGLYGAQMLIGAANIWTTFSDVVRASHLAAGAAIWALAVVLVVAAAYQPGEATQEAGAAPQAGGGREPARA